DGGHASLCPPYRLPNEPGPPLSRSPSPSPLRSRRLPLPNTCCGSWTAPSDRRPRGEFRKDCPDSANQLFTGRLRDRVMVAGVWRPEWSAENSDAEAFPCDHRRFVRLASARPMMTTLAFVTEVEDAIARGTS